MCNKCDTPAVPATELLSRWAERKDSTYRGVFIRDFMQNQYQTENVQYWSHARLYWAKVERPENQQRGHKLAYLKALANKQASREPMSIQDIEPLTTYFKSLEYINGRIANEIEPAYYNTSNKLRDGTWEALDIMNKLHPYLNDTLNSTHEQYVASQAGFVQLDRLHRVHISTEDINQIAYYPSLKHMREGREVRTRLGRYLTKYQQALSLTESDIKNITEKHASNMRARGGWEVGFVDHNDADGWLEVYRSPDVNSCMQDMEAIRIYAHEQSVLRLAYVKAGERIIARCIVREDDAKGWLRVYPDPNGYSEGRYLLDYLKTNGYETQTNLDGVRLRYITEGSRIVCPYIDSGYGGDQSVDVVHEEGKTYLVAGGCEYSATNTDGFVEDNTQDCDACGDSVDEQEITYIEHDGYNVCECCRDNNYTYAYGRRYQDYFPEDECIQVGEDYYWLETINDHDIYQCDHSGEYHHIDDLITTIDGLYHQDFVVSLDHADSDGNDYAYKDSAHTLSDGTTCHVDDADSYQLEIDAEAGEV